MSDFIKVLNINYDSNEVGGVPIFLMSVYHNINHDKIQIDFLTPNTTSYNPWREEIENTGGSIFEFHINCSSFRGRLKFGRELRSFLSEHPYDIVHINCGAVSFDCIIAVVAKLKRSKVIVHSHNTGGRSWWKVPVVFLMKLIMQRKADALCACSIDAALNIFTRRKVASGKVIIINNGIDLQKFWFDSEMRKKLRREMGLDNCLVIGHIGRFVEQKNHEFLIDIFAECLRKEPKAILLLIGQGELENHIREKVRNLNIENNVLFLGQRSDVADLYQAMDLFLFPSLFEGFGLVLVEAQMSGLPCYISDVIPREVDLTDLIHRISLRKSAKEWAKEILAGGTNQNIRLSHEKELMDAGYSIQTTASKITQIYDSLMHIEVD